MPQDLANLVGQGEEYIVFCRYYKSGTYNGLAKEVHVAPNELRQTLYECRYVDGITIVLSRETDVQALVNRLCAQVTEVQHLTGITVYLCYSHLICGGIKVDEECVNLQFAVTNTAVYVGSPVLLGSY